MKIKQLYHESRTSKILSWLFAPRNIFRLSESRLGQITSKIENNYVAQALVLVSTFVLLYQKVIPNVLHGFAPWLLVAAVILVKKNDIYVNKAVVWLLFFFGGIMVSSLVGVLIFQLNPTMVFLGWLLFAQFVVSMLVGKAFRKDRLLISLAILILPISTYGIFQYFTTRATTLLWVTPLENISVRASSILGDPNLLGMLSLVGLVATVFYALQKNKWFLSVTPIFIVSIVLSYSRTAWLALAIMVPVILAISYRKFLKYYPLMLLAFLIPKVRERIAVIFNPEFVRISSLDGRIWILDNALFIWKHSPLFGYGAGSYGGVVARDYASPVYLLGQQHGYTPIYFTDGQWTELLVQGGIFSLLGYAGFAVSAFYKLLTDYFKNNEISSLAGVSALLFVVVAGFTSNILEFGAIILPTSLIIGSYLLDA